MNTESTDRFLVAARNIIQKDSAKIVRDIYDNRADYLNGHKLILSVPPGTIREEKKVVKEVENKKNLFEKLGEMHEIVAPLFQYSQFFFYNYEINKIMQKGQKAEFKISISLSFDSNIPKEIGHFNSNNIDGISKGKAGCILTLIDLIEKNRENINFDYFFYLAEEFKNDQSNYNNKSRVLKHLNALKLFDKYTIQNYKKNKQGAFFSHDDLRQANKNALETYDLFKTNNEFDKFRMHQKITYFVLLKAMLLKWSKSTSTNQKITLLIDHVFHSLDGFPHIEIYYGWKLITSELNFFGKIQRPVKGQHNRILENVNNMSWDIFTFRSQQQIIDQLERQTEFVIPYLITNDRRFRDLSKEFPVKAYLFSSTNPHDSMMIRVDEMQFRSDLTLYTTPNTACQIENPKEMERRKKQPLDEEKIARKITELENKVKKACS